MAEIISGVYKIINTITKDFYIGSSKDVKRRWAQHKCPSYLKKHPNNQLYKDMQKYGKDYFVFEILEEVEIEHLKEKEQQFIEKLKPTYNDRNANGCDFEKKKEYFKSDKYKEYNKEYKKEYYQHNSKNIKKRQNKYNNQLCRYNGESLTLATLKMRFQKAGIAHPTIEAKKYLVL